MTELYRIGMRKVVIPEFIFGVGARRLVGRYVTNYSAQCAFVVSDEGIAAAGWLHDIITILDELGVHHHCFTAVSPNPKHEEVMHGVQMYRREGCDIIIAVGGGSPMDCAKGIGILSTNQGDIRDYAGIDAIPIPGPPLICIPTTAGSAADVSQFAIITDTTERRKMVLVSKSLVPDVSLLDPEVTVTMDTELTAYTALDALTHAIEAVVSRACWVYTDIHAMAAIPRIVEHLPGAIAHPDNLGHRTELLYASDLAGIAFSNASLGLVHAMAHSVGGYRDSTHGVTNAILLPHVIAYNYQYSRETYDRIAMSLGIPVDNLPTEARADALIERIRVFFDSVGVPRTLSALGIQREDIPQLAENALQDICIATNPRRPTREDVEELYANAIQ